MSTSTEVERLTPASRLARGVKYTIVGPLNLLLGVLGIGFGSVQGLIGLIARRCRDTEVSADELALTSQVLAPATSRRRRPLLVLGGVGVLLAVGAATFSIIRRSMQPEPSPLPPSVDVTPQP